MIYQQYTTAIKEAYSGEQSVFQHAQTARMFREWLESLQIEVEFRNALVEPIRAVEEAFEDLVASPRW